MKGKKKIWARIIAWCMVITMLPIGGLVQNVAAATDDTTLTAALAEAKEYTDALTINNSNTLFFFFLFLISILLYYLIVNLI